MLVQNNIFEIYRKNLKIEYYQKSNFQQLIYYFYESIK